MIDSIAPNVAARPASPVGPLWEERLSPLLLVGLGLALQNSRRDLPWAVLVSGLACLGTMAGSSMLDGNLAHPVGTVVAAHLWSRRAARPSSIILIPAIVMLAKGTIGFRGLVSTAGREILLGTQQFLRMFVVAMTTYEEIAISHLIVRREPGL